jgi:putative transposase
MVHPYPAVCPTFDYKGRVSYSLTFKTSERRKLFESAAIVGLVLQQFSRAAVERQFEILVYCFMPDHVHMIVRGLDTSSDAKAFIKLAKQYSGFYYARRDAGTRLWQRYGHDRIIRDDVELLDRIRYVVNNPVAAGLVKTPEEYPYLGSECWTTAELIRICEGAIPVADSDR